MFLKLKGFKIINKETLWQSAKYHIWRRIQVANENKTEWSHEDPKIINETVRAARDFLNAELAKYDSYEQACHGGKFTTVIFSSNSQFMQCKGIDTKTGKMIGVGRDIILNSLAKDYGKNLKLE